MLLTVTELARREGLSRGHVRQLIQKEGLRVYPGPGEEELVDLDEFLDLVHELEDEFEDETEEEDEDDGCE